MGTNLSDRKPGEFSIEQHGRGTKDRPRKLPKEVKEDLLTEIQRLRAENESLKNLQTLVLEDERCQHKKRWQFRSWGKDIPWKFFSQSLNCPVQPSTIIWNEWIVRINRDAKEEITAIYHENKGPAINVSQWNFAAEICPWTTRLSNGLCESWAWLSCQKEEVPFLQGRRG